MALVKISELTAAAALVGTEEYPIVQDGNTKKATTGTSDALTLTGDQTITSGPKTVNADFWLGTSYRQDVEAKAASAAQRLVLGNGASKPLSGFYGSLGAAQADYPHATALTDELDWAVWQAAVNTAKAEIHAKGALYKFGGRSVTLRNNQTFEGPGRVRGVISTLDAYAFVTPTAGPLDNVIIAGFGFVLEAGSTSGGAIKAVGAAASTPYHSGWVLEDLIAQGDVDSPDPLFWLDGFLGSKAKGVAAQECQTGFFIDSTEFPSNACTFEDLRTVLCTQYGFRAYGGGGLRLKESTFETNLGYGVYLDRIAGPSVENIWGEDNGREHLVLDRCSSAKVRGGKFHYHMASAHSPSHILITSPDPAPGSTLAYNNVLDGVLCVDAAPSGAQITIGQYVADATITGSTGSIADSGVRTSIIGGAITVGGFPMQKLSSNPIQGLTRHQPASEVGDSPVHTTAQWVAGDPTDTDYVRVLRKGYLAQRTASGDPGTGLLQTHEFFLFWDNATNALRVRVRDGAGAEATYPLNILPLANNWPSLQTFAGGVAVNYTGVYFKPAPGGASSGWALISTPTTLKIREESNNVTRLEVDGTGMGFFGKAPVAQPAANPDTSGASLADLEAEVNQLKATLRSLGLMA